MNDARNERARRRRKERAQREGRETVTRLDGRVVPRHYLTQRALSDHAHATRKGGETLADALRRARRELSAVPVEIEGDRGE